jgi:G:T/U-mismatch repair DNA glycosylase
MKTRIRVEETNNGNKTYYPEKNTKWWEGWRPIWFYDSTLPNTYPYQQKESHCTHSLEEAKRAVDRALRIEKKRIQDKHDYALKQTTIIKYP